MSGIIDTVFVDDERIAKRAELDQTVPVAAGAR